MKILCRHSGFTLLELSIVLVIVSMIVGAVVAGQKLVNNAKRNALIAEVNQLQQAMNSFELEYNALPGDVEEAFAYWGTRCAASAGACNGDGDGLIDTDERARVFVHLSLAGFYAGDYGSEGSVAFSGQSAFGASGYSEQAGYLLHSVSSYYGRDGVMAEFANWGSGGQSNILSPQDGYKLDIKADDGVASTGDMIAFGVGGSGCVAVVSGGALATPDINSVAGEVDYDLDQESATCALGWFLR